MAPGKVDEAMAWLREVQSWEFYRLLYPRGCRIWATVLGRTHKVVIEAEYGDLRERLWGLLQSTRQPQYQAWRERQAQCCLDVYCCCTWTNGNGDGLERCLPPVDFFPVLR